MGVLILSVYFIAIVIAAFYFFIKRQYSYWDKRNIENVEPTFPFGSFKGVNVTKCLHDVIETIYSKYKNKVSFVGSYFLINPGVIILDLDLVKNILVTDFNNFTERGVYCNERDDPLSGHLFSLDGQKWKSLRSKLSPTFTSGKMKFMFPTVLEVGEKFSDVLSEYVDKSSNIEVKDLLARFTTDIIGTCAFGIECNSLKDPNAEFRKMGRRIFENPRFGSLVQGLIFNYPNIAKHFRIKLSDELVSEFFLKVVRETVEYREKNNISRNDFLDLLINIRKEGTDGGLTVEEMAAQVFIFFLAGFETSSTTMGFCLYELAQNQDIQDKLRAEIREVLAGNNGAFTYECMAKLRYLDQVIMETLRKYPPVVTLLRKCSSDYECQKSGYIIPKGIKCIIPVYSIQHDPDMYPEPETFNPDRFSPENIQNRHSASWLAFGDGPRNCIGLRFGKMQTRIGLVKLIDKFKFSVNENTPIPIKFNLKNPLLCSEGGINLTVVKL